MADETDVILEFDLKQYGGPQVFRSVEEIEEWIKTEREFWEWLIPLEGGNPFRLWVPRITTATKTVTSALRNYKKSNDANRKQNHTELQNAFNTHYCVDYPCHSSTGEAQLVNQLKEDDPDVAAFALAYFMDLLTSVPVSRRLLKGASFAINYESGMTATTSLADYEALGTFLLKWQTEFANLKREYGTLNATTLEFREETKTDIAKLKQGQKEFNDSKTAELNDLKTAYEQDLAVKAPSTYWRNKKRWHIGLAISFGLISIAVAAGGIWGIFEARTQLFPTQELISSEISENLKFGFLIKYTAGLVIVVTLAIWAVRIFVRLFLSNLHLATDAAERAVMITTYRSLAKNNEVSKETLPTVLDAIFRHTSDGVVKDDALPLVAGEIAKAVKGK